MGSPFKAPVSLIVNFSFMSCALARILIEYTVNRRTHGLLATALWVNYNPAISQSATEYLHTTRSASTMEGVSAMFCTLCQSPFRKFGKDSRDCVGLTDHVWSVAELLAKIAE